MKKVLRIIDGEAVWLDEDELTFEAKPPKEIKSDALGCTIHTINESVADAKINGFNVEFKPDPTMIEDGKALFYQACFSSEAERDRYARHINPTMVDRTQCQEAVLSPRDLSSAVERMLKKYPQRGAK